MNRKEQVWAGVCLVLGMMAIGQAVYTYETENAIFDRGTSTEARVQRLVSVTQCTGRRADKRFFVKLAFTKPNGTAASVIHGISGEQFGRLHKGGKVHVAYIENDPNMVRLTSERPDGFYVGFMTFIGIGMLLVGVSCPLPIRQ